MDKGMGEDNQGEGSNNSNGWNGHQCLLQMQRRVATVIEQLSHGAIEISLFLSVMKHLKKLNESIKGVYQVFLYLVNLIVSDC